MSFVPKISISDIPRDASSMKVTDITGVSPTDTTGYGQAAYLPSGNTIWTKQLYKQYLGAVPEKILFPTGEETAVYSTVDTELLDGVYLVTEYFSILKTPGQPNVPLYTISGDLKTLTNNASSMPWKDPLGFFEGAYGLIKSATASFDVNNISVIDTINTNSVVLKTALTGASADSPFWIVYKASKYILVTALGEGKLISDIGDINLSELSCGQGCSIEVADELMRRVLLKTSASIAFACGNYTKAHNAAILLSNATSVTQPCSNCG